MWSQDKWQHYQLDRDMILLYWQAEIWAKAEGRLRAAEAAVGGQEEAVTTQLSAPHRQV